MSEANGKVCCNCGNCIRIEDGKGMVDHNECAIDGSHLGYLDTMTYWCRHWKRERKWDNE